MQLKLINSHFLGDYWRLLTPGEYEVIAMADGYEPLAKLIEVTDHGHTGTMHTQALITAGRVEKNSFVQVKKQKGWKFS